jgi:hypothetical protein
VNTPQNRRNFVENYAKDNGFDPLIPGNWYSVDIKKSVSSVLVFLLYFISHQLFKLYLFREE